MVDLHDRVQTALRSAQLGSQVAVSEFRTELEVETKANKNDLVSNADRAAQRAILNCITTEFPDDTIVAEENGQDSSIAGSEPIWVVDPIDGTTNFVRGFPLWSTTVAVVRDGEPIAGVTVLPAISEEYVATPTDTYRNEEPITVTNTDDTDQFLMGILGSGSTEEVARYASLSRACIEDFGDIRRFGCTTAALAFVSSGVLDAAITGTPKSPWDVIAGAHMIRCAGGTVTTLDGERWGVTDSMLVASNGEAHATVLEKAKQVLR